MCVRTRALRSFSTARVPPAAVEDSVADSVEIGTAATGGDFVETAVDSAVSAVTGENAGATVPAGMTGKSDSDGLSSFRCEGPGHFFTYLQLENFAVGGAMIQ